MSNIKKLFGTFLIVLLTVGFLTGQVYAEETSLYYGLHAGDMGTMDPHMSSATNDVQVADALYDSLIKFPLGEVDFENVKPNLAEDWEVSEDGLEWTFYLREGVQFHNDFGEMTSEDVVFSLRKAADSERSTFASRYDKFETIEAIDDYTVRIVLSEMIPSVVGVLGDFHGGLIISKAAYEEYGDEFALNPVGTGPFKFESYSPGERLILSRHDEYFKGTPKLEEVVYQYMPDRVSRESALEAGELHLMGGYPAQWWVEEMQSRVDNIIVDAIGPGSTLMLHLNMSMEPLDDIRVRQAIAYSIDREELVEWMGADIAEPAPSIVPPGYLGYTDEVEHYNVDRDRARELLAEAGYPDGLDLGEIVVSEDPFFQDNIEVIQAQLEQGGIDFDINTVDHATFHERIRDNVSPLVIYTAARFPVAHTYLSEFFHSDAIVLKDTAVTNFSHYDKIDNYIDEAASEPNIEKQVELWEASQIQGMEDIPAYPIFMRPSVDVRSTSVHLGYEPGTSMISGYRISHETAIE